MAAVYPAKLTRGAHVRVVAPSRSLEGLKRQSGLTEEDLQLAQRRLEELGLVVSFAKHAFDCDEHLSSPAQARADDLHAAFSDESVHAILAAAGGINAIQLLPRLDYGLIARHPKIVCGYSDVAMLLAALGTRCGLVTYYGPNFASFGMRLGLEYTLRGFRECLFEAQAFAVVPAAEWSDDAWARDQQARLFRPNDGFWAIQEGEAEGTLVGGNLSCLNALQGSPYFPELRSALLLLESPGEGKASLMDLDRGLRALSFQPGFDGVRGLVLGRYPASARIGLSGLRAVLRANTAFARLPVIANVDFGHTTPVRTFPLGGQARVRVSPAGCELGVLAH